MNEASGRWGSLVEAAVLALVAAGVLAASTGWPAPLVPGVPGPAFFPRMLAGLLIGCAAGIAARAHRRPGAADRIERNQVLAVLGITGSLLAVPWAGALIVLPVLVAGLTGLAGERSPVVVVGTALGFAGAAHLLFVGVLHVALP